jgi:hypothetical protein
MRLLHELRRLLLKTAFHVMNDTTQLLERFRRGAEMVAAVTTGATSAEIDFAPSASAWSIRQIVCHLSDSEIVGAHRFRLVIAESNATLTAFDQNAWGANLNYKSRKLTEALDSFRLLRALNFELLRTLPVEAYARTGHHTERGTVSLLDLLRIYTEHAESHTRQIQSVREQYRESRKSA